MSTAVALTVLGAALGGVAGVLHPMAGMVVGAGGIFLGGGAWAVGRSGGAGLFAAFMGAIAGVSFAIEGHHAWVVKRVEVVRVPSLAQWSPSASAALTTPLTALRAYEVTHAFKVRSKNSSRTAHRTATPLVEHSEGAVVGFICDDEDNRGPRAGVIALRVSDYEGSMPDGCADAVELSLAKLKAAEREVSASAATSVVRLFESERELRAAHKLDFAITCSLGLLAVFAVLAFVVKGREA